jgi:uncharacterized protein involved in type VI secretion and phage assembly
MRLIERVERVKAERDRYMAEASERQQAIGRLEAERDALAAQLERDCNALNCLIDDERAINQTMAAQCAALAEECGANPNDIPAAAAVYLAAERAMEAHGDPVMWTPALIAWRKAAGK